MSIIRIQKTGNYSVISNEPLDNPELSFKAKGLLCYLLTKPSSWTVNVRHLITVSKDGRDSVYSIIEELVQAGYIRKEQQKSQGGKFLCYDYTVYETSKPLTEKPETVSPDPEKPDISNTDLKVNTEGRAAKAASANEELKDRKINFLKAVLDWEKEHPGKYPKLLYKSFVEYWTEKSVHKKKRLMRFEKQEFFEIGKRLSTWFKNTRDTELSMMYEKEAKIEAINILFRKLI